MNRLAAALCLLLLVPACAHVDYIGRSYPPTSNVELFFAEADVVESYEVMGRVHARANDLVSAEKLQTKIMEKARANGADAVVILGFERYKTGEHTSYSERTKERRRGTETSGSVSTSDESEKAIEAIFLKYKN
jgi:hypothetical protein